eukprot:TRINITY_DN2544_c0_g1_i1.p1 TRINITY_DN2544_c0_g1~~TRINITY_DN2544_c0_g1_i1.p1  ORF type:complete len:1754 (-),score=290.76 TRINITY_DN2544_c0_g1_i1:836-6097(-)
MAALQGPALLFYNDKCFSEQDIQGIQQLGQGGKREDDSKIGKFGLGFNSCYAITDAPSFITGDSLYFFDPQAKHVPNTNEESPGRAFPFLENSLVSTYPDQFGPYKISDFDFTQPLDGALFRFPIRLESSNISQNVIALQDIRRLVNTFSDQAGKMLLFLKHVQEIEVSIWERGSHQPRVLSRVTADCEPLDINAGLSLVKKVIAESDNACKTWLIATREVNEQRNLDSDALRLLRGRGERTVARGEVAIPVTIEGDQIVALPALQGSIYCFLPLAIHSGVNAHINGYFAVQSNRRDMWSSANASTPEQKALHQWNKGLVEDIVVSAWVYLLVKVSELMHPNCGSDFYAKLFPDVPSTPSFSFHKELVAALYRSLNERALFLSYPSQSPCWYTLEDCYFPTYEARLDDLLAMEKLPLTQAPAKIAKALTEYGITILAMQPQIVRDHFRLGPLSGMKTWKFGESPYPSLTNLENLLLLLGYCLRDLKSMDQMKRVALLPLAEKDSFTSFSSEVYLCQQDIINLFPDHQHKFGHHQLRPILSTELKQVNITRITVPELAELLPMVLPSSWRSQERVKLDSETRKEWLVRFWKIYSQDLGDLSSVDYPILLTTDGYLVRPRDRNRILLAGDSSLQTIFSLLGIMFLDPCLQFLNPLHLRRWGYETFFFEGVSPESVLKVVALQKSSVVIKLNCLDHSQLEELLVWLISARNSAQLETLKSMPLFESLDGSYVSVDENDWVLLPQGVPSLPRARDHYFLKDNSRLSSFITTVLRIQRITPERFYLEYVFPGFLSLPWDVQLEHLDYVNKNCMYNRNIVKKLTELAFIRVKGTLVTANSLWDPQDPILGVLAESTQLPSDPFTTDDWLAFLRKLGLQSSLNTKNIKVCVKRIEALSSSMDKSKLKTIAESVLKWIARHSPKDIDLAAIKFVPSMLPQDLPYPDISHCQKVFFMAPQSMGLYEVADLCFTQMGIVSLKDLTSRDYPGLRDLGFYSKEKDVLIPHLVNHIKKLLSLNVRDDHILRLVRQTQTHLSGRLQNREDHSSLDDLKSLPCIFNQRAFRKPFELTLKTREDLAPFMIKMEGRDIASMRSFLLRVGVVEDVDGEVLGQILYRIYQEQNGRPLDPNPNAEHKVFRILKWLPLCQTKPTQLYVPDTNLVLRPSNTVYFSDGRNRSQTVLSLLHSRISRKVATQLGIQLASSRIVEKVIHDQTDAVDNQVECPELTQAQFLMTKPIFTTVLRKVLEFATPNQVKLLENLVNLKCRKVTKIYSRLQDREDQHGYEDIDVTCRIYSEDNNTIYVTTGLDDVLIVLGTSILKARLPDMQLRKLLMTEGEEALDLLLRQEFDIDPAKTSSSRREMGSVLDAFTEFNLKMSPVQTFDVGEVIAFVDPDQEDVYRLGTIRAAVGDRNSFDPSTKYQVQVSPDEGDLRYIPITYLFKFASQREDADGRTPGKEVPVHLTEEGQPSLPYAVGSEESAKTASEPHRKTREEEAKIWKEVILYMQDLATKPRQEQKTAIKRLCIKYHPDKHQNEQDFYTPLMAYIIECHKRFENGDSIVGLEKIFMPQEENENSSDNSRDDSHPKSRPFDFRDSFNDFFSRHQEWNSYSHFHRQRKNYNRGHRNQGTNVPNPMEAEKWFKAAQHDMDMAEWLENQGKYAESCFYSHQTAAKSIRAAAFKLGARGIDDEIIDLLRAASLSGVFSQTGLNARDFSCLSDFFHKARHPSQGLMGEIPSKRLAATDARSCLEKAEKICGACARV